MEEKKQKENRKKFMAYDYKEIRAEQGRLSFLLDGYESFGWELDENITGRKNMEHQGNSVPGKSSRQTFYLKRDRKIVNKVELTRLQRNFEACVTEIDALEKEKTSRPAMAAITVGLIGTAFMAGSVFAVTASSPLIILCIILAVPGFIGWIAPYFIYQKMTAGQTEKFRPLIEKKYDEIYEICEKGNSLLY